MKEREKIWTQKQLDPQTVEDSVTQGLGRVHTAPPGLTTTLSRLTACDPKESRQWVLQLGALAKILRTRGKGSRGTSLQTTTGRHCQRQRQVAAIKKSRSETRPLPNCSRPWFSATLISTQQDPWQGLETFWLSPLKGLGEGRGGMVLLLPEKHPDGASGIWWVETEGAAICSTLLHRAVPHNKEWSDTTCQQGQGWEPMV